MSKWESVRNNVSRLKVPGGWIVNVSFGAENTKNWFSKFFTKTLGNSFFISDPEWKWELK
ncbi:MAG TPA: hypothetical protein VGW78_07695 [Candidatus Babeliales bacterium]|jgi:hypothetical protein|nr:hypothetical protein [Candidatus Babeliales bacterium]